MIGSIFAIQFLRLVSCNNIQSLRLVLVSVIWPSAILSSIYSVFAILSSICDWFNKILSGLCDWFNAIRSSICDWFQSILCRLWDWYNAIRSSLWLVPFNTIQYLLSDSCTTVQSLDSSNDPVINCSVGCAFQCDISIKSRLLQQLVPL